MYSTEASYPKATEEYGDAPDIEAEVTDSICIEVKPLTVLYRSDLREVDLVVGRVAARDEDTSRAPPS